ncbi:hypothetical protein HK104_002762, partial [Borealophlyctis nickersoniae]
MKAIVRQAHGAFANHLVRYYDVIVLPEFMTAGMVRKRRQLLKLPPMQDREDVNTAPRDGKFTLHKTTRKAMQWISHHAFRQRCFAKALADPNDIKDVICTTEEYSTKQCPFCDFVHHKIGSNKIYKCGNPECGFEGRRDNIASDEEEWSAFLARVQQSRRAANRILYRRLVSATKGVVKQLK